MKNKRWNKQDTEYLKKNYNKVDIEELTVRLDRSKEAIRWQASNM